MEKEYRPIGIEEAMHDASIVLAETAVIPPLYEEFLMQEAKDVLLDEFINEAFTYKSVRDPEKGAKRFLKLFDIWRDGKLRDADRRIEDEPILEDKIIWEISPDSVRERLCRLTMRQSRLVYDIGVDPSDQESELDYMNFLGGAHRTAIKGVELYNKINETNTFQETMDSGSVTFIRDINKEFKDTIKKDEEEMFDHKEKLIRCITRMKTFRMGEGSIESVGHRFNELLPDIKKHFAELFRYRGEDGDDKRIKAAEALTHEDFLRYTGEQAEYVTNMFFFSNMDHEEYTRIKAEIIHLYLVIKSACRELQQSEQG